jgi:hypothetical protein
MESGTRESGPLMTNAASQPAALALTVLAERVVFLRCGRANSMNVAISPCFLVTRPTTHHILAKL